MIYHRFWEVYPSFLMFSTLDFWGLNPRFSEAKSWFSGVKPLALKVAVVVFNCKVEVTKNTGFYDEVVQKSAGTLEHWNAGTHSCRNWVSKFL